ncbi:DUF3105 domain-containing protein [Actinorugispora endophytica]|uniref:Uncharacterized protein DUF3105 n=1 Tax=Actinorugispora endophytica TaxID=1605990 RepID=A0A4R6V1B0_9ACTN|nr:DUF3105 domain-containing protein [Actinorugispora endophytica]TDQ53663.1 uncharacterized protein DUF3105 [Actinorugispora endophytica]
MSKSSAERRRQRAAEMRAQREREARRRKALTTVGITAAAVVVIGGVGFAGYMEYQRRNIDGVQEFDGLTNDHVTEEVKYEQSPPVGGDHSSYWQNCGVYTAPVKHIHAVHSLEHGAVWVNYSPDLPADQVERLEALYTPGSYVLVSPYEGEMEAPIVLSAWGHQLPLESPDDSRLDAFVQLYEQGEQTLEPGAACSGAIDFTAAEIDQMIADQAEGGGEEAPTEDGEAPAQDEEVPAQE